MLSRGLIDLVVCKKTIPFSKPSNCPIISHLSFVDGMMILANGFKKSLQQLMQFLALYETELG